jgi:hypothetical protein
MDQCWKHGNETQEVRKIFATRKFTIVVTNPPLPCPYPEPDQSSQYQPILSLKETYTYMPVTSATLIVEACYVFE